MYAVQFVVPDEQDEEHHFTQFAAATQYYTKRTNSHERGIILLWSFDPALNAWVFLQGIVHFFTGKPGYMALRSAPDTCPPLNPAALVHLLASKSAETPHPAHAY